MCRAQPVRILSALDLRVHRDNLQHLRMPMAWADGDAFIEPAIFEEVARPVPPARTTPELAEAFLSLARR